MSRREHVVDTSAFTADLTDAFAPLREIVEDIPDLAPHLAHIETFCAVALRVMARTNPSKIREAARLVEIQARIKGHHVYE